MSDKLPKTDLRSEVTIKHWGISKWEHGNAIVWQPTKRTIQGVNFMTRTVTEVIKNIIPFEVIK